MGERLNHQLPVDLVLKEIIARVPIESQTCFRTTCRAFYNRTFDMDYIYKHFDLSRQRFLRLDHMVHVIHPESNAVNSTAMLTCLNHGNTISNVIHCDGLLLCRNLQTCMITFGTLIKSNFARYNQWTFSLHLTVTV